MSDNPLARNNLTFMGFDFLGLNRAPAPIEMGRDYVKKGELFVPPAAAVDYSAVLSSYFVPPISYAASYAPYSIGLFGTPKVKAAKPDADTTRTEPFVGWKTLTIKVTKKGNVKLVGQGNVKYGITATAECTRNATHNAPEWSCSCGFYALSAKPTSAEHGWFIANVELFGTVIEGEFGWRASRQRVLSLEVFRTCQAADGECDQSADGFQVGRGGKVWPVCAKHAPLGVSSLADIRAQVGTEVKWAA